MGKLLVWLLLLAVLLPSFAFGQIITAYPSPVKSTEWVSLPVPKALDTITGNPRRPDSIQIQTFIPTQKAKIFSDRSATYPFTGLASPSAFDTLITYAGDTVYNFRDSVGHLNAGSTSRVLTVKVTVFYNKAPTSYAWLLTILSDTYANWLGNNYWNGGAVVAPNVTGIPLVDLKYWMGVIAHNTQGNSSADTMPHVSMSQVDGVALGTHASGLPPADVRDWKGTAVDTTGATGQINTNVKSINSVVAATPGASNGLLIAGTNAATTFTTSLTVNHLIGTLDSVSKAGVGVGGILASSFGAGALGDSTKWYNTSIVTDTTYKQWLHGQIKNDTILRVTDVTNNVGIIADQNVNVHKFGGTTVTGKDIGAGMFLDATQAAYAPLKITDTPNFAGKYSIITDSVWKKLFATVVAGSYADSLKAILDKATGSGLDSSATSRIIKRLIYGLPSGPAGSSDSTTLAQRLVTATVSAGGLTATQDQRLTALWAYLFKDSLIKVKYVSPKGDNTTGLTLSTAKTSPNYIGAAADSNTIWIVASGVYDTCRLEILARNVTIIGAGWGSTIFKADSVLKGSAASQPRIIRAYKPNFTVQGVEFWSTPVGGFSLGDEDSLVVHASEPWPCAIEFFADANNGKVLSCKFPARNYKTIVSCDTAVAGKSGGGYAMYGLEVAYCLSDSNQMYFLDINAHAANIHDNIIQNIRSNISNGSAGIQFYSRGGGVVTRNYFTNMEIALAGQNDTGTTVTHNYYGYFPSYGARITNNKSVKFTLDEPTLFPFVSQSYVNLLKNPGLEDFSQDKTLPTGWATPLLSTADTFPDARVVSAKSRTGAYSWYANCHESSHQATFGPDTLTLDTGTYIATAWVYASNGSLTSIKIRDLQQTDSTYDVTSWSHPDTNKWTMVQSKFVHHRFGKVKLQFITHHNSICFWDDFSFVKATSFNPLTDSVIVNMASFNADIDNDSTLTMFLRGAQRQVIQIPFAVPIYGGVYSAYTFAEASARLDSMRYAVMRQMNLPVTGTGLVTPAVVNGIINQAIQTVSTNFPAIERFDTVSVTISGEGAPLNNDFIAIHTVKRIIGDTLRIPLDTLPLGSQNGQFTTVGGEANMLQNLTNVTSPKYYGVFRKQIQLYPKFMKPTGYIDSLLVEYYANGHYLSSDSDQCDVPAAYRDAVWYLTLANLYALRSMYTDAGYWTSQYNALGPKKFMAMPKYQESAIQK